MSSRLGGILLGALLALGAVFLFTRTPIPATPIETGRPAPSFSLPRVGDGGPLALADLRGKVVLVNFWATWCKPCEDEMPAMERLHRELAGEPFELVAISVDGGTDEVVDFRDRMDLTFTILHDPDKEASADYQSFKYPETYLIDEEGVLVARYVGPREWDAPEYEARIRRLLDEGGS